MKRILWQLYFGLVVCGMLMFLLGAMILMGGCTPQKPAPKPPPGEYMPYTQPARAQDPLHMLRADESWEQLWKSYDWQRDGMADRNGHPMSIDCEGRAFLVDGVWYLRVDLWASWKILGTGFEKAQQLCDQGEIVILGPDNQIVAHYPDPNPAGLKEVRAYLQEHNLVR